jgi:hypothetical protein
MAEDSDRGSPLRTGGPVAAVRYLIAYGAGAGDGLRLVRRGAVPAVAPLPPDGPAPDGAVTGFWCEVRDGAGTVLHRQRLRDPRHPTAEVPARPGSAGRHVRRAAAGTFTVVVPDLPDARSVCLVARGSGDDRPRDVLVVPAGPGPRERR